MESDLDYIEEFINFTILTLFYWIRYAVRISNFGINKMMSIFLLKNIQIDKTIEKSS